MYKYLNTWRIILIFTWNHKLFTTLLSTIRGSIHNALNIIERKECVIDHAVLPISDLCPKMITKKYWTKGRRPYSNNNILNQNTPPLSPQHCKVLFKIFPSLQKFKGISAYLYFKNWVSSQIIKWWRPLHLGG